jgi:hypothetical protein
MYISKKEFEELKGKYDIEVRQGKPGTNASGDISHQTDWIFFDRSTIEKLLKTADQDPNKGGIKFYFGQYTEALAKKYFPTNSEAYDGMLTLVMTAANLEGDVVQDVEVTTGDGDDGGFENHGKQCPPHCDPQP